MVRRLVRFGWIAALIALPGGALFGESTFDPYGPLPVMALPRIIDPLPLSLPPNQPPATHKAMSYDFGGWTLHIASGHSVSPDAATRDSWYDSSRLEYKLSDSFAVGAEIFKHSAPPGIQQSGGSKGGGLAAWYKLGDGQGLEFTLGSDQRGMTNAGHAASVLHYQVRF